MKNSDTIEMEVILTDYIKKSFKNYKKAKQHNYKHTVNFMLPIQKHASLLKVMGRLKKTHLCIDKEALLITWTHFAIFFLNIIHFLENLLKISD